MSSTYLSNDVFKLVVDNTPLISLDLVVRNASGQILLGERVNRPAQGYWFVPGGRIRKNETIADAFMRLTLDELGVALPISSARYLGLFEHFYSDSVFGNTPSTHYVVNAFEISIDSNLTDLPNQQHSGYLWWGESQLLDSKKVHVHSKWYFLKDNGIECSKGSA
ncbi:GDP-mannose mannosyl hydrolase [Neptunomonas phycophila]|uniref:GDP-mannose mannosyl hydrolase n=1 Tax=Neptunomonas phycophila TaxID=1572645 RepID=UPI000948F49B|nr:GDP-mannose mannosyl hydrolase [Neptunomonas phycophila]